MHTTREDGGRIVSEASAASKLSLAESALHAVVKKTILSLIQNVLHSEVVPWDTTEKSQSLSTETS